MLFVSLLLSLQPGIKILHSPDSDFRTTVYTLAAALQQITTAWIVGSLAL